jgi:phospholipase/carboxylesterase
MAGENLGFIHAFVPPPSGEPTPTLLLLHGTGGDERQLLGLGASLAPGAALLSPHGKVFEHGAARFFRRFAEGVFDIEDLRARTHELADFVVAAAKTYGIDARRIFAVGYSNGANIAGSMLLLRPEVLSGAVLFKPMVPLVPEALPKLGGVPVLLSAGRHDPIVPLDQPERMAELLRKAGADVTLRWYDAGHGLERQEVDEAREWLAGEARFFHL